MTPDELLAQAYGRLFPKSGDAMLAERDAEFARELAGLKGVKRDADGRFQPDPVRQLFSKSYDAMVRQHRGGK